MIRSATPAADPPGRGCHCGRAGCANGAPAGVELDGYLTWEESIRLQEFYTPAILRWLLERAELAELGRENGPLGPMAHLRNGVPVEYVRHEPAPRVIRKRLPAKP